MVHLAQLMIGMDIKRAHEVLHVELVRAAGTFAFLLSTLWELGQVKSGAPYFSISGLFCSPRPAFLDQVINGIITLRGAAPSAERRVSRSFFLGGDLS